MVVNGHWKVKVKAKPCLVTYLVSDPPSLYLTITALKKDDLR